MGGGAAQAELLHAMLTKQLSLSCLGAAQPELPCNWFCCWYAGVELDSSLPSRTLQDLPNTHEHLPVWGSTADDEEDEVLDVGDTCKFDCDLFMTIFTLQMEFGRINKWKHPCDHLIMGQQAECRTHSGRTNSPFG